MAGHPSRANFLRSNFAKDTFQKDEIVFSLKKIYRQEFLIVFPNLKFF